MIAFILGDLCRYPAVGWGKTACFPGRPAKYPLCQSYSDDINE
jgi:hypothetical protein